MRMAMIVCTVILITTSAQALNVDIYSGFTQNGGGAPYSNLVGSFTSPDIQFATDTAYAWHPFGLASFGAEISGCLRVAADGTYTFTLDSDDGSMLYIDGALVVDNGGAHAPQVVSNTATLTAGKHPFRVEFFEDWGGPSGVDLTLPAGVTYAPCVEPSVTKMASPKDIWLADSCAEPQTTTITLTVTGYGGTTTETIPIDVVYGIDSSGSMSWNDPSGLRKTAAKEFTDKLDAARDQAGVVSWDSSINFTYGLSSDLTEVKNQIDNVDSSGGTNLNAGLNACIAMLDANPRTGNSVEVIIFLTDGQGTYTYSNGSTAPADVAAAKGYTVYSIGLGGASAGPLMDIADTTGGQYYDAPSADNLQAIFNAIFTEVLISTAPYNVDVSDMTQAYIIDEGSFTTAPDSIITIDGKQKMTWLNVAQYVGNNDDRLTAEETFEVSFTARSAVFGVDIAVDVLPYSKVTYLDPDGDPQWTQIPQAHLTVGRCVNVDIKPQSCPNPLNTKDQGVLPVAVVGTGDFDVDDLMPETLELTREGVDETVPVLRWAYEDVESPFEGDLCDCHATGPDGIMDLTLKFDVPELVEKLQLGEIEKKTMVSLTLVGNLKDGTPIQGSDCVRIQ